MKKEILVSEGKYKGIKGEIVHMFKDTMLLRVPKTSLGGRYQEHYSGWIIKVYKTFI